MSDFFDNKRKKTVDGFTLKTLKAVFARDELKKLSTFGFHFQQALPSNWETAFEWLDDSIFGPQRIKFFSRKMQTSYDDFVSHSMRLSHEISMSYSSGRVNAIDLTSGQKSKLSGKLDNLSKKTVSAAENLFIVAKKELK